MLQHVAVTLNNSVRQKGNIIDMKIAAVVVVVAMVTLVVGCNSTDNEMSSNDFDGSWSFGCSATNYSDANSEIELIEIEGDKLIQLLAYYSDSSCETMTEISKSVNSITYYENQEVSTNFGNAVAVDLKFEYEEYNSQMVVSENTENNESNNLYSHTVLLERDGYLFLEWAFFAFVEREPSGGEERRASFRTLLPRWEIGY